MEKLCPQCETTKSVADFYKNKSKKDGLQRCCKTCCNINSKKFRDINPEYYWGNDGYFTKDKEKFLKYSRDISRADKSSKIYSIETPDGIYIGSTKRMLYKRMGTHLTDYRAGKKDKSRYCIPLLHGSFNKYSIDEVKEFLKNVKLIEEFDGNILETRRKESYWMEYHKQMGFTLLNIKDAWGPISQKKYEEFGKLK